MTIKGRLPTGIFTMSMESFASTPGSPNSKWGRGAENAGLENAGTENVGPHGKAANI